MKIYLAARYSRLEELQGYAEELRAAGHNITARWLEGDHQMDETAQGDDTFSVPIEGQQVAIDDFEDVVKADAVISFSEPPRTALTRGGRHVEFGVGLGLGKLLLLVGPRENVFHTMPQVMQFWTWGPEVVRHLEQYAGQAEPGLTLSGHASGVDAHGN